MGFWLYDGSVWSETLIISLMRWRLGNVWSSEVRSFRRILVWKSSIEFMNEKSIFILEFFFRRFFKRVWFIMVKSKRALDSRSKGSSSLLMLLHDS